MPTKPKFATCIFVNASVSATLSAKSSSPCPAIQTILFAAERLCSAVFRKHVTDNTVALRSAVLPYDGVALFGLYAQVSSDMRKILKNICKLQKMKRIWAVLTDYHHDSMKKAKKLARDLAMS